MPLPKPTEHVFEIVEYREKKLLLESVMYSCRYFHAVIEVNSHTLGVGGDNK